MDQFFSSLDSAASHNQPQTLRSQALSEPRVPSLPPPLRTDTLDFKRQSQAAAPHSGNEATMFTPVSVKPAPIDLTSQLINSNLSQIKLSATTADNSQWMPTPSRMPAAAADSWLSAGGNMVGAFNAAASQNFTTPPFNRPNLNVSNSNSSQSFSALDNLLPAKPKPAPMGQTQYSQPLLIASNVAANSDSSKNANQLSSQDIMDFLK